MLQRRDSTGQVGTNSRIKSQFTISLLLMVQMYEAIKQVFIAYSVR